MEHAQRDRAVITVASMSVPLILSIIALVVSVASAVIAWVAAVAARRTAAAEEGTLAIERERRLEERKPRLTAVLKGTGSQRVLKITLDAEEPLAGEGDEDACADFGSEVAERIGEGAVEWDRQSDVGVEGHRLRV